MKRSSLFLSAILFAISLQAQYFEVGTYIGTSNYIGDLSEQRLSANGFNTMLGIYGKYNATKYFSIKGSVTKGGISGSDQNAKLKANRERNLSFRSDVLELAFTGEVNLSPYNIRANKTGVPYFFSGIALTHFNPEAQMRGSWYYLQPLRTEGNKYSRYTVAVPLGFGMKFNLSYKVNFGFEIGARKTFTDYLDDVSAKYPDIIELRGTNPSSAALSYRTPELTGEFGPNPVGTARGDSGNKDWYLFGGMTLSVNLADKYGIDFDPQYDIFKEQAQPEKKEDKKVGKRKKKAKFQLRLRLKGRKMLEPQAKKRTN